MNSSLTYKRLTKILCLLAVLVLTVGTLCACSKEGVYRIDSFTWISGESIGTKIAYTYTEDSKPDTVTVEHPFSYEESYTDKYEYNKRGNLTTVTRVFNTGAVHTYTADKITNYKYILYDKDKKEYLTIVFDHSGFIVSERYANGYVTEYGFSYDENGKPLSMKQLSVTPSGSNKTIDYIARFTDANTYRLYPSGEEKTEKDEYYEVKFQMIEVKG
ncbi:MAG: hypothetical protein E7565_05660 [Ruminococcaceae bacterium]|nr:hypothetical protein [Oscillospiraceae bacterium]